MIGVTSRNLQTQKTEPHARKKQYADIVRAQAGDQKAINQIIRASRGLIIKEAQRYRGQVDWPVLIAAGEMGVANAVKRFNISTGNQFSTYAVPAIRSEIRDRFCDETGIRRTTMENLTKISKASTALEQQLGRKPTLEEISQASGLSQKQILTAGEKKRITQTSSLNQTFTNSECEWLDVQADESINVWQTAEDGEILGVLSELETNGHLEYRQVQALIAKVQGYTNKDVGQKLGISGERVRQLLRSTKDTLIAFFAGTLQPIKAAIPVSTHCDLPVLEEIRTPVLKRIDASRLGGRIFSRIGKVLQKISKLNFANGDRTLISPSINAASHCNDSKQSHNGGQVDV
ncbi:MAG: sigma-70 family RNA polymerase sigma factor, partial [Acaryochloris sp. RU_4_1]|nr:sigma-70 family RNA polymerase sigma factor [Acaryochloris sp. RU_4_1]NJR56849.1 sigma-70 family RNA polymerase sigma factor [Acaryochloris sp. CRU_2_0]